MIWSEVVLEVRYVILMNIECRGLVSEPASRQARRGCARSRTEALFSETIITRAM